jgi:chondroitin AC lyase
MARQGFLSPAAIDRNIWAKNALLVADTFAPAIEEWAQIDTERAAELKAFARSLRSEGDPLVGFRFFPFGDFAGFHRPDFACLLKTITQRSLGLEPIGGYAPMSLNWVNTGEYFLLRDGREYNNLLPVWDWSRLPGLTIDGPQKMPALPALGGGVGDGISGLVAVDVERVHGDWNALGSSANKPGVRAAAETEGRKVGTFTLRKLFAMHGDTVVCLLGGWQRTGLTGEFSTSLDQCRWRGPVLAADADQPVRPLAEGQHKLTATRWVLHQKLGYMPLLPSPIDVSLRKVSGNWSKVTGMYRASDPGDKVDEELLTLVFPHGAEPSSTGYVVVGDASPEKMEALHRTPTWTVLANTRDLQAVRFAGGPLMAAFYAPGQLTTEGLSLSVDRPCLIQVGTDGAIRFADPLFKGGTVSVVLNGRTVNLAMPASGATAVNLRVLGTRFDAMLYRAGLLSATASLPPALITADSDRDGLPNLLDYALGGSLSAPDAAPAPEQADGQLRLTFTRDTRVSDVTLQVEATSVLETGPWTVIAESIQGTGWTGSAQVSETATADANRKQVTVTDPGTGPRRFLRLRAVYQP